jgi:hypothetical protein
MASGEQDVVETTDTVVIRERFEVTHSGTSSTGSP